jgi:hypothetical protein
MAKAGDRDSTEILLREARALVAASVGSAALAKKLLTEELAAGRLPWTCMRWEGLDDEGLAKLHQSHREMNYYAITPSATYCAGDPEFWSASNFEIDWEDNTAREKVTGGAQAFGIKVPRARLLVLLSPEETLQSPTKKPTVSLSDLTDWYVNTYIPSRTTVSGRPSREEDETAADDRFKGFYVPRDWLRDLRRNHAPEPWRKSGRNPSN